MSTQVDIRVQDVGTVYFVPTYDNDLAEANFDPSSATTKQLRFRMPGASGLCVRSATAAQKTIAGVSVWGLQYTVTAADVAAWVSTAEGGFHQAAGDVMVEAYLEFSSAQKWSSSIGSIDQQGRPVKVRALLTA